MEGVSEVKLDNFVLWKFKTVEGVLCGARSMEVFSTGLKYNGNCCRIDYDIKNNTATLVDILDGGREVFKCKFRDIVDCLKRVDLYHERQDDRHESSRIPFAGDPDEP